jgi:pimeloyl-ACP methyl ester carboxylesterase
VLERRRVTSGSAAFFFWGARDTVFPVTAARKMLPQFREGTRLVEIPDARFLVHEERAERVAASVRAFFEA